jgi:serine/threonine-protein kinase SRPK3
MASPGSEAGDYTESDDEGEASYVRGGYHRVTPGDVFAERYRVVAKLGWGHFSTVWLCLDTRTSAYVALKIQKSAQHYTEAAYDEIDLLATASKQQEAQGEAGVVRLLDYFEHQGPNGTHVCMVFEVMGPNVLALIKQCDFKGVPEPMVRSIAHDTLIGLDFLHRVCGIIHTDLKPENVLVSCPFGVPIDKHGLPLIDLDATPPPPPQLAENVAKRSKARGKAAEVDRLDTSGDNESPPFVKGSFRRSGSDQTGLCSYSRDPEKAKLFRLPAIYNPPSSSEQVSFGARGRGSNDSAEPRPRGTGYATDAPAPATMASVVGTIPAETLAKFKKDGLNPFLHKPAGTFKLADLGNACWLNRHFSEEIQTRQYRSPEVILGAGYHTSADMWSLACMVFELMTGDYLFDPKSSEEYPRDEDHLALAIELLGRVPESLLMKARHRRTYMNLHGELRHIKALRYNSLEQVLRSKYRMHQVMARTLSSFLLPLLDLDPDARATAQNHLNHPWLRGLPSPDCDEFNQPTGQTELAMAHATREEMARRAAQAEQWGDGRDFGADRSQRAAVDPRTGRSVPELLGAPGAEGREAEDVLLGSP